MASLKNDYFQSLESKITMPGGLAKFEDSKPRGKMTAYAFFVQTCRPASTIIFVSVGFIGKTSESEKGPSSEAIHFPITSGRDAYMLQKV